MRRLLVLFAREPGAGRVKTRLAPALGAERAAALYAAFLADLAPALRGPWTARVACADAAGAPALAGLFPGWEIAPQAGSGLGERMAAAFAAARAEGFGAAAVAGSDAPLLSAADVGAAFDALAAGADVAFAPAPDGGFSLVAARAGVDAAALFHRARFSTEHALADVRANASALGLEVALLPEVPDVDRAEDVERLRRRLEGDPGAAPATARLLRAWEAA